MSYGNSQNWIFEMDSKSIWESIDSKRFQNTTLLITGGTGLIGSTLVRALLYANRHNNLHLKIILWVRNQKKAEAIFGNGDGLEFIEHDLLRMPRVSNKIDYIIHCANPTSSAFFLNNPADTINIAVEGTKNILEIARRNNTRSVIFLSSMEVYGFPKRGQKVTEKMLGGFDPTQPRNSYPISKQLCESLCCAYATQYQIPAKIIRLTQTFGPGVDYYDGRIFAEFARCAKEKRNIVLLTPGQTERCYLYTADAVTAILTVLLDGEVGQAYTAANKNTYCSILQMAQNFAKDNNLQVEIVPQDVNKLGYADTLYMNLDTEKIERLGWKPKVGLMEMFQRMMEAM